MRQAMTRRQRYERARRCAECTYWRAAEEARGDLDARPSRCRLTGRPEPAWRCCPEWRAMLALVGMGPSERGRGAPLVLPAVDLRRQE